MWSTASTAMLVPIFGIIFVFGIPIVAIIGGIMYASRRARLQQELLMKLAETGQPIPPELFHSDLFNGRRTGKSPLRGGLVVSAAGIGVMLYGWILGETSLVAAGLIPLVIGLALLLAAVIEGRKSKATITPDTTTTPS
ncbi:DUF6249 domain-containing protein [Metallibacterium scheffleri]|nr:DUF6249 domain-containing protein [Metallibacterium scheffleri]